MKLASRTRRVTSLLLSSFLLSCCIDGAAAQDEAAIAKLQQQVDAIEKSVADPTAGERAYAASHARLVLLQQQADAMIDKFRLKEDDADSPLFKLHFRITRLLRDVRGRLPDQPETAAAGTGLPVPQFDDRKLLGKLAQELESRHNELADHLRRSPKDSAGAGEILVNLVLKQEELAWEAGWPFTEEEAVAYKKSGKLAPDIYLQRRERGLERINQQLQLDASSVGREAQREFVIHHPTDTEAQQAITKSLFERRGEAAKVWMKGTKPLDETEQKALLSGPRAR